MFHRERDAGVAREATSGLGAQTATGFDLAATGTVLLQCLEIGVQHHVGGRVLCCRRRQVRTRHHLEGIGAPRAGRQVRSVDELGNLDERGLDRRLDQPRDLGRDPHVDGVRAIVVAYGPHGTPGHLRGGQIAVGEQPGTFVAGDDPGRLTTLSPAGESKLGGSASTINRPSASTRSGIVCEVGTREGRFGVVVT